MGQSPTIARSPGEGFRLALAPPIENAAVALGRSPLRPCPPNRGLLAPRPLAGSPLDALGRFLEQALRLRRGAAFAAQTGDDDIPSLRTAPDVNEIPASKATRRLDPLVRNLDETTRDSLRSQ